MAVNRLKKVKGDQYYGRTARNYEKVRTKQEWWGVEQQEMKSLLEKLPEGLSVIDIPFGTGRFVPYYLERGFKVHGLDASDEMIATAKTILGEDFDKCETKQGLSTELPYADGEFDLLVSTRFLRDIILFSDVKKTMSEFARVTTRFAIIQLGIRTVEPFVIPPDDERMNSRMSWQQTDAFLESYGFHRIDNRNVKTAPDGNSEIHHILLERL